jgi:hypothetical protein
MTHWFYAVLVENGITWSTAVRAKYLTAARRQLAARYPQATIFSIER